MKIDKNKDKKMAIGLQINTKSTCSSNLEFQIGETWSMQSNLKHCSPFIELEKPECRMFYVN